MKLLGVEESFVAGTRKSIKFERKHDKVRGSSGHLYEKKMKRYEKCENKYTISYF